MYRSPEAKNQMDSRHLQRMIIAEVVRVRNNGLSAGEVCDAVHSGLTMARHLPGADMKTCDEKKTDRDET